MQLTGSYEIDKLLSDLHIKSLTHKKDILDTKYNILSKVQFFDWLKTISKLHNAGYGATVVSSYIKHSIKLAEKLAPATVFELSKTVSILTINSGKVSGTLISEQSLTLSKYTSGEAEFIACLAFIENLSKSIPHCIESLLKNVDLLLEKLGWHKFKSWALAGVRLNALDKQKQLHYFQLKSVESKLWLSRESNTLIFSEIKKQMYLFLKAVWDLDVSLRESITESEINGIQHASFGNGLIFLPTSFPDIEGVTNDQTFLSCVAHIGAHIRYSGPQFLLEKRKPIQLVVSSIIEDARIEHLAMKDFPGLKHFWLPYHKVETSTILSAPNLIERLSRALIDDEYSDDNYWVIKGKKLFFDAQNRWKDPTLSLEIGDKLSNDLGQMRVQFDFKKYTVQPLYRDNNDGLWDWQNSTPPDDIDAEEILQAASPKENKNSENNDTEKDYNTDSASTQLASPESIQMDKLLIAKYPEFDYLVGEMRPDWTLVYDYSHPTHNVKSQSSFLDRHKKTINKIASIISRTKLSRPSRIRNLHDGDFLNIDSCIEAKVCIRNNETPDPKLYEKWERQTRDLSVLILIDISESTTKIVTVTKKTVLDLEKEACALLSESLSKIQDPFSICAFSSNTRKEIRYHTIKCFKERYDKNTLLRLNTLTSGYSTRLGAALRHSGEILKAQKSNRKLLLVLTDGQPSDIDVSDPKYLQHDARKSVMALNQKGIDTFCIGLDRNSTPYLDKIFGSRNSLHLRKVEDLPQEMLSIYMRLAV